MNACLIKMSGPVKEVMKFMIDNMIFTEVDDSGVKFTVKMDFSKSIQQYDAIFAEGNYGVRLMEMCNRMKVVINKYNYYEEFEYNCYEEDLPNDVYNFRVVRYGNNYDMFKIYEKEVCFRDRYVKQPKVFMNDFFSHFSDNKSKDMMGYCMMLEIELQTLELPTEVFKLWAEKYNIVIHADWADEKEFKMYNVENGDDEYLDVINADENLERYTRLLLDHKWANNSAIFNDICDMLYDMKDNFPVALDMELKEIKEGEPVPRIKYKYNTVISNISTLVHNTATNNPTVLAKLYTSLTKLHEEFMNNK